jgi:hypothetical protein|tara:strand:- start:111 stop:314 length:204 start_codon:yes stop_codon:yes gene_type:complete
MKTTSNRQQAIDAEIATLLKKRQELIEGTAGDGVYAGVDTEQLSGLYEAYGRMIDQLLIAAKNSTQA